MVLMMKPRVGLTVLTSSPIILLTIVVLPALSRPLHYRLATRPLLTRENDMNAHSIKMRSSLSLSLAFRRMDSIFSAALCTDERYVPGR